MTNEEIKTAVEACLAEIDGKDGQEVGAKLAERGVKGIPGSESCCVIAEWVRKAVPAIADLCVLVVPYKPKRSPRGGYYDPDGRFVEIGVDALRVSLPVAVASLAQMFDRKYFPELTKTLA